MEIKQEVLEVLYKTDYLLKDEAFSDKIKIAVNSKSNMTWLDIASTVLPIAIDSVENSKVHLSSATKNAIVTNVVLPLIKDKLPWYIKPFASKLISWAIDLIVSTLNKLFTKKWKKESPDTEVKQAEGTISE